MGKLGQGGMGSVWRAEHLALGSSLAIKLIDPGITQSPEAAVRFKREAQAAADLRSAHVVQIIDYGVDDGLPFIAMELLDGESLGARLERMGRLAPDQAASILSQVARALARAHQAGVVHRDLKPDNVFLVREADGDIVKVLDFGIAKKLGVLSTTSGIKTGTGAMLGTPYYMSPEQVLGGSDIDHRADIWSLGIIAYECLTGQRPFEKETLGGLLMAICNDPLPVPSKVASVPSGFDAWFARACARDTSARLTQLSRQPPI
jgi:serine/threonine-protein kinase